MLYSINDRLELFGDIIMIRNNDTLKCDSLYYFPTIKEYLIAIGGVKLSKENLFINSEAKIYDLPIFIFNGPFFKKENPLVGSSI